MAVVEPFYGGSHKQLVDLLVNDLPDTASVEAFTLPDKKWHWRLRAAAPHFAAALPAAPLSDRFDVLFCSSMLNLAELRALRPDVAAVHTVLFFHENQLEYPVTGKRGITGGSSTAISSTASRSTASATARVLTV